MVPLTQTIQAICTLLPLASVSTMTWKWPFPLFLQQSLSITISIASIEITFLNKCMLCLVAQSCPTLCDPMDCSLTGSSVHGDSPGKHSGVSRHSLLQEIFLTQGLSPVSPAWQADSIPSEVPGSPFQRVCPPQTSLKYPLSHLLSPCPSPFFSCFPTGLISICSASFSFSPS